MFWGCEGEGAGATQGGKRPFSQRCLQGETCRAHPLCSCMMNSIRGISSEVKLSDPLRTKAWAGQGGVGQDDRNTNEVSAAPRGQGRFPTDWLVVE